MFVELVDVRLDSQPQGLLLLHCYCRCGRHGCSGSLCVRVCVTGPLATNVGGKLGKVFAQKQDN